MLSSDDKKAIFLVGLRELDGNVSRSCEAAQISRTTYYNWLEQDEKFMMAVRAIQLEVDDEVLDQAEEVLRMWLNVKVDKEVAKWILSKKGAKRGYGTKVTVQHEGEGFKGLEYPSEPASVSEWADDGQQAPLGAG